MAQYTFPVPKATDILRLKPNQLFITPTATTTETDILLVSGKGQLKELVFGYSSADFVNCKLYIDGVLKWTGRNGSTNTGFCYIGENFSLATPISSSIFISSYVNNSTNGVNTSSSTSASSLLAYGNTTQTENSLVKALEPIPFEASLRITVTASATTKTSKISVDYNLFV